MVENDLCRQIQVPGLDTKFSCQEDKQQSCQACCWSYQAAVEFGETSMWPTQVSVANMKRSPKLQLTGPPAGRIWAETWYITYNHSYWTYNTNLANYGAPPYSCWWYPYDTTLSAGIPKCLPPASNKRWTSASVSSPTLLAGGNTTEIPSDNLTVCYESHGPLVSAHGVFLVYALCFMVIPCHGRKVTTLNHYMKIWIDDHPQIIMGKQAMFYPCHMV
jgi:hypothetical protein